MAYIKRRATTTAFKIIGIMALGGLPQPTKKHGVRIPASIESKLKIACLNLFWNPTRWTKIILNTYLGLLFLTALRSSTFSPTCDLSERLSQEKS